MSEYQIVCTDRVEAHEHITHVGLAGMTTRYTVDQVCQSISEGNHFYTVSPSTLRRAGVEPYELEARGRMIRTLRSTPDAVPDNDLDNLPRFMF
jgi:hypothetical protein